MNLKQIFNLNIIGLYILGMISIVSGALQLEMLNTGLSSGDASHDPGVPHYYAIPLPVILHIAAGLVFNILSPLQFSQRIRKNYRIWHKASGMLLVACAIMAGVTAFIMNEIYPAFGGLIKYAGVMTFAIAICFCVIKGVISIARGEIAQHRAWMIRATALALGPATQRLFFIPTFLILGQLDQWVIGVGIWVGFTANLIIAETLIIPRNKELSEPAIATTS